MEFMHEETRFNALTDAGSFAQTACELPVIQWDHPLLINSLGRMSDVGFWTG
jgi:hypothetical protein